MDPQITIPRKVLLVEPFPELRDYLLGLLVKAGCEVDMAMTGYEMEVALTASHYDCVLINIDQNRAVNFGLVLAATASATGSRIIMIPDCEMDRTSIDERGWLRLEKPFTVADILAVLAQAAGPEGASVAVQLRADQYQA